MKIKSWLRGERETENGKLARLRLVCLQSGAEQTDRQTHEMKNDTPHCLSLQIIDMIIILNIVY